MATLFQWLRNPVFLRPPLVAIVIGKQFPGGYSPEAFDAGYCVIMTHRTGFLRNA